MAILVILTVVQKHQTVIKEAQKRLRQKPRDVSHDLKHHQRVWENCQRIVEVEHLVVNLSVLQIAAFWHDVVVGEEKWPSILMVQETVAVLQTEMSQHGFSAGEIAVATGAILTHEFRSSPTSVEGLVLQDADKLDVLSEERWEETLQAYKIGKMSQEKFVSYMTTFLKWVPILSATFHYAFSRQQVNRRIDQFWGESRWQREIEKVGLGERYEKARKEMSSPQTKVMRLVLLGKNFFQKMKLALR